MANSQKLTKEHVNSLIGLLRPYWPWFVASIVFSVGAGVASALLVATTNKLLHTVGQATSQDVLLTFVGLGLAAVVFRFISAASTNHIGQSIVAKLRQDLAARILTAPIDQLERYRTHRIMPVLTQDVDMVSDVIFGLAELIVSSAIVIGCFFYLATLSLPLFTLFILTLLLGTAVQAYAQAKGIAGFGLAREQEEILHSHYRTITAGAKELRLQRARRIQLRDGQIQQTIDAIRNINKKAINTYLVAAGLASALLYVLIGLILGWGSRNAMAPELVSGFILVLFFAHGAFGEVVGILPGLGRAKVAFLRISDLHQQFSTSESEPTPATSKAPPDFVQEIELRDVSYQYAADPEKPKDVPFKVGPLSLKMKGGELTFIIGNNGSGKTTLIKILLGLYKPASGKILVNQELVTDANIDEYRQLFSTVFADFHLFEEIPPALTKHADEAERANAIQRYLKKLEISKKVRITDGKYSTLDVSTGQRKRLALLNAYLEQRPVVIFDEWAADQDPHFRNAFYTEILPELKKEGHTVISISHDDRYFDLADHIIRLEDGMLRVEEKPQIH